MGRTKNQKGRKAERRGCCQNIKKWLSLQSCSGLACHGDSMPPTTTPTHIRLPLCVIGTAEPGSSHL